MYILFKCGMGLKIEFKCTPQIKIISECDLKYYYSH